MAVSVDGWSPYEGEFVLRMKWLLGLVLAVVLVGVSACGGGNGSDEGEASDPAASQEQAEGQAEGSPDADVEDVPEVVAEVNGEEIDRDEFVEAYELQLRQAATQAQASGQEVDQDQLKEQVAESLVSTELLVQEADQRDITVSEQDVEQTLQELAAQNGLDSVDAFVDALGQEGMDRDEVDYQVRTQMRIEQLVADEAGDITVTKQDARALYDQLVAQQEQSGAQGGQQMPPFPQVRPDLEEQVKSQKENQVAQRLLGDLREAADITVNL